MSPVSRSPVHLIRRCHQIQDALFAEETGHFGVTPAQIAALKALARCPGIDQASLAEHIAYDHCTLSGILERLETKAFIVRTPSVTDRRKKQLALTPTGAKLLKVIEKPARRVESRLLAVLAPDEQRVFVHMLERIVTVHERQNDLDLASEQPA
jgi:DNA-binding MarR family transcriptional regulator